MAEMMSETKEMTRTCELHPGARVVYLIRENPNGCPWCNERRENIGSRNDKEINSRLEKLNRQLNDVAGL